MGILIMNIYHAEIIRKKYKYRNLIMNNKISLPFKDAVKLIGPDCAYHLYSNYKKKKNIGSRRD